MCSRMNPRFLRVSSMAAQWQELMADALELEVELESGDPGIGAVEFVIHVSEVILAADDVGQQGVGSEFPRR